MTRNTTSPSALTGLREIAADYDAIICDVWGVLHNGVQAWESAHRALTAFKEETGGTVVLITNAPRPNAPVFSQLETLCVPRSAFDDIVTSGDVTRAALEKLAGKPFFKLGPERDNPVYEGLNLSFVSAEDAEAISVTGPFDDENETPEDYRALFETFLAKSLPMVCANPDIVVERGDRMIYCGGALAQLYQQMGGETIIVGKPHAPIYERVMEKVEASAGRAVERDRVLAIGDGFPTDVKGAYDNGFDCFFVSGGIHAADFGSFETPDASKVSAGLSERGLGARVFAPRLAW